MSPICRSVYSSCRFGLQLIAKRFYSKDCISNLVKKRLPFDLSLYLVANRPSFQDESLFFSKIMKSVEGGVSCVQLRDRRDLTSTLKTATHLKTMLQDKGVPLFINTSHLFEVAQAVSADGVYLEEGLH